jgi:hypothetical protein
LTTQRHPLQRSAGVDSPFGLAHAAETRPRSRHDAKNGEFLEE